MSLDECVAAAQAAKAVTVCAVQQNHALEVISSLAGIFASLAVIATAVFAFIQIRYLKKQMSDARDAASAQVTVAKDDARLTSTLNILVQLQTNSHWRENRLKFLELRDNKDGLKKFAQETTDDALCIRSQLNQYEMIALGIEAKILDESMYRKYYRGTVMRDWAACLPFIEAERADNAAYWIRLESLVARFKQP